MLSNFTMIDGVQVSSFIHPPMQWLLHVYKNATICGQASVYAKHD